MHVQITKVIFFLEINWNIQTIKRNISKTSFIFPKNKSKLEDFIKTIEINLNCILFLDFLSTRWSFNTSSVCIFHDIIKLIAVKTDKDLSKIFSSFSWWIYANMQMLSQKILLLHLETVISNSILIIEADLWLSFV